MKKKQQQQQQQKKLQTFLQSAKQKKYIHFHHKNLKYRYVTIKI